MKSMLRKSIQLLCLASAGFAAHLAQATVLVSNFNSANITQFSASGMLETNLIAGGSGGLALPHRSRLAPDGTIVIASAATDNVLRYDAGTGAYLGEFIAASGGLDYPVDMIFHHDGFVYVSSQLTNQVLRFNATTGARDMGWAAADASLSGPSGIAFDSSGNLYVAGRFSNNVARFSENGTFSLAFGDVPSAFSIAFRADGSLLVNSGANGTVEAFATPAAIPSQTTWISGLNVPVGIEPDANENFLIAEYGASQIRLIDGTTGSLLSIFASGAPLDGPNFLSVIPEPSTAALLVAAWGLAFRRRR